MALFPRPILTNGATHSAQQFRMLVRDLARGAEGITEGDDLKVTQRSTPGAGVLIGDGSGVIQGRVNAFQGHYSVCNIGAIDVPIAATGASARSDMLILRVEDPEYEGSLNPAVDQIVYPQIISNVSSSATTIPDGRTGIPLARIDIPASTSTITNAMIIDVRKLANPRRDRRQFLASPTSSSNLSGTANTYTYWSSVPGWTLAVPDWATTVIIRIDVGQIKYDLGNIGASFRATFGASLVTQPVTIDENAPNGSNPWRNTIVSGDTLTLPATYRGTSQLLRPQAACFGTNAGRLTMDASTTVIYDVEFLEAPR
jgi:hypothetical protein